MHAVRGGPQEDNAAGWPWSWTQTIRGHSPLPTLECTIVHLSYRGAIFMGAALREQGVTESICIAHMTETRYGLYTLKILASWCKDLPSCRLPKVSLICKFLLIKLDIYQSGVGCHFLQTTCSPLLSLYEGQFQISPRKHSSSHINKSKY